MDCDKSQQPEIARLQTLFSKVTDSLNVTALMKHQCVSGGVKKEITAFQINRKTLECQRCRFVEGGLSIQLDVTGEEK